MTNPKRTKKEELQGVEDQMREAEMMEQAEAEAADDGSDDDSGESSSDEEMEQEVVNIEFEAFPPDDTDFHGIKKLLSQIFRNAQVNVSDLTKHLIETNNMSIVLKQSDEELSQDEEDDDIDEVYGITGLLPLARDRDGVKSVRKFLIEQISKDAAMKSRLAEVFSSGKCALFVSERFVNLPPRIALQCYESIWNDWSKLPATDKLKEIQHLIMVCKQYAGASETIFGNAEEELLVSFAELNFTYKVAESDADTAVSGKWKQSDEELKQMRQVLLIKMSDMPKVINTIKENL